jgi:hypothetical protein
MRLLLTTVLCLAASTVAAQSTPSSPIARGSRLIGGSANVARVMIEEDDGTETRYTTMSVNPMLLWFIRDRLAIGGEVGLGRTVGKDFRSTSLRIGPAVRLFFAQPLAKTLPFLGAAVTFGSENSRFGTTDLDGSQEELELVAGATQMVARHVGLTGELFLGRVNTESDFDGDFGPFSSESKVTTFGVRFGITAFVF